MIKPLRFSACLIFGVLAITGAIAQHKGTVAYKDTVVTNFFKRGNGVTAADGGFSTHLPDGRTLWTFGDAFIDNIDPKTGMVPCLFQVNNAAMVQPPNNWRWEDTQTLIGDETPGVPFGRSLFKSPHKGEFYWPVSATLIEDTIYIFCSGVKLTGEGTLGFDYSGRNVLTKMKYPEMIVVGYHQLQEFYGVHYGVGFVQDANDGHTYVYGIKGVKQNNNLHLAKFATANPNGPWQCWTGTGWTDDMSKSAIVKSNVGSTPNLITVRNKIVLVSSEFSMGCDMGKNIYTATAGKVTGPFTNLKSIYTIDDTLNGHYPFFYVPVAHPQYINNSNEILVTYCINGYGTCAPACVDGKMDPNRYRIRGIRVPLDLIDAGIKKK
ncbi:DUF5005 domain-containing protein [Mucilaginibacter hurinus]|uniref:DUF5005 domain-containing protein n=1 Tax=Mucilaginibacter hurinus TaxID=2201324 RepID=UPI00131459C9|nr:DUF5005 domain-containing protein [Mucilaginibacter hurinus]